MKILEIKSKLESYRDQFDSDLIAYHESILTKEECASVIRTQISHNRDRQTEDERALENLARELGLDL